MRKVLLATTAIAAMGVTAAQADLSISGNYEWEYVTNDAGTQFTDDGHINITAVNAADNGTTWTAKSVLTNSSDDAAQTNMKQLTSKLKATLVRSSLVTSMIVQLLLWMVLLAVITTSKLRVA